MKVKFSNNGYKVKPTGAEFGKIVNQIKAQATYESTLKELVYRISKGYNFLLADYGDKLGISTEDIKGIEYLVLDIDSKEEQAVINIYSMVKLIYKKVWSNPIIIYPTFSDSGDNTKFRLIYRLERIISVSEHQQIMQGLLLDNEIGKYLDKQCINANRIFCGTNKEMWINEYSWIGNRSINELIQEGKNYTYTNTPNNKITALKEPSKGINKEFKFKDELYNNLYIKGEFKNELTDYIKAKINIYDFIIATFGGSFKPKRGVFVGCCPIHENADNPTAFEIITDTNTYRCHTKCKAAGTPIGNVLSVAYQFYGTNDFSEMALKLAEDGYIGIDKKYIGIKRGNN